MPLQMEIPPDHQAKGVLIHVGDVSLPQRERRLEHELVPFADASPPSYMARHGGPGSRRAKEAVILLLC